MIVGAYEEKPTRDVSLHLKVLYSAFTLPLIIFVTSHFPLNIAVILLFLILVLYIYVLKEEAGKKNSSIRFFTREVLYTSILLAAALGTISGGSRLFSTSLNWDWVKHDAILNDC